MSFHVTPADLAAFQANAGAAISAPRKRAKPEQRETRHQIAIFQWQRAMLKRYPMLERLHAIPNGGDRRRGEAKMLKAQGVLPGVSDICLPFPARGYHGLYIELKDLGRENEKDGGLTPDQLKFLQGVADDGYCGVAAYGSNQAIDVLEWYLGIKDRMPAARLITGRLMPGGPLM